MPYQSAGSGRVVEEEGLLPDDVNIGVPNSARGDGTATAELVAKLRFLNCAACLFILLFHSLPLLLNPVRLTLLVSSPVRLVLEILVALLALFLLLVEARIPILGERVLILMSKLSVGSCQCIDLDVARGRVLVLSIMGACLVLINYLALAARGGVPSSSPSGSDDADVGVDAGGADATNVTSANITADPGHDAHVGKDNETVFASAFFVVIRCIVFSPSIWIILLLVGYTIYVMQTFPEYSESRGYSIQTGRSNAATETASEGPSWASNVGNFARGSGYQTVGS
ncbi:hypothetical protein ACHAXT_006755 [Thalassiosira profunda]